MRTTIFLSTALAALVAGQSTNQPTSLSLPSVTFPSAPTLSAQSATDALQSNLQSFESLATALVSGSIATGTDKPNLPTNTAERASFLTVAASLQSAATGLVASYTGSGSAVYKSQVSADGKALSKLESSWSMTPSAASAATGSSASSATGSSKGAAPIMTAAPIVFGGVAAAALALL